MAPEARDTYVEAPSADFSFRSAEMRGRSGDLVRYAG